MKEQKTENEASKGKWLSVFVEPEELETIEGIQAKLNELGLGMSQSKVIRRFMAIGFKHTEIEDVLAYPVPFFTNHREGELHHD